MSFDDVVLEKEKEFAPLSKNPFILYRQIVSLPPIQSAPEWQHLSGLGLPTHDEMEDSTARVMADGDDDDDDDDDDDPDNDMITEEEARVQELEEQMREENLEKMGRTLRGWLPKSDALASLMPDSMLAEQIVRSVSIEGAPPAACEKRHSSAVETKSRKKVRTGNSRRSGLATTNPDNPFSRIFSHNSSSSHQSTMNSPEEEEERLSDEQEALFFMTIWIQHHVDPVLKAVASQRQEQPNTNQCHLEESQSSSCSYILPFPDAVELLDCMRQMTISTARPYRPNPFATTPKPGTSCDHTAYLM